MKLLLDENVEYRLAALLTTERHDVTAIAHDYPASLSDRAVLALAHAEDRILITNDRDFGELIFNQQLPHAGVIYFRLPLDTLVSDKMERLQQLFAEHQADLASFIVVMPDSVRVR